jgi:pyruvate dehydrogenase E1 component
VLFAYTDAERAPAGRPWHDGDLGAPGLLSGAAGGSPARARPVPPAAGSRGASLCARVAAALDRPPASPADPPWVPADVGRSYTGTLSTQAALGSVLHDLTSAAPQAATAVVTVSTSDADRVVAGWIASQRRTGGGWPTGPVAALPPARTQQAPPQSATQAPHPGPGGAGPGEQDARHVAGGLSAGAFAGVLGSLGVAWSRAGLPLLPLGVAEEAVAAKVLPAWSAGAAGDARSVLAIIDRPDSPAPGAAWAGRSAVAGAVCWEPAFAQDLVWIALAAFGALARVDGTSSIIRLSARPIEQRLAAVPADEPGRRRRRAAALAGAYRLRDGGGRPTLTLAGVGAVMPEVLRAADELSAGLGRSVCVVCVTSTDLLFHAVQARRGLADGPSAVLDDVFPARLRSPLLTVVDGDPQRLAFLAGVHGDPITTLGTVSSTTTGGDRGAGWTSPGAPVELKTIIGAALDLLDETEAAPDPTP